MLIRIFALFIGLAACATPAKAAFHFWQISEVYSNASGSIQFVELFTDQSSQQFVQLAGPFTSNSNSYQITTDLPGDSANKRFILATPGYFALSGVPPANYNLGVNNFFNVNGDTLTLNGLTFPELTFTAGELPLDGVNSLNRAYLGAFTAPPTTYTMMTNSPTNFAGQTGTVVVPEPATAAAICGLFGVACLMRRQRHHG